MMYLSLAVYEKANDKVGRFLDKHKLHPKGLAHRIASEEPSKAAEPRASNSNDPNDKFETAKIYYKLKFYEWLRWKKVDRYFLFLWTMRSVSTALLYGSETFWLLALFSAVLSLLWLPVSINIWLWLACSTFIVVVIYLFFYAPFQTKYEMSHRKIYEVFRNWELSSANEVPSESCTHLKLP
jgi:hypothetical protein